jgi:hypothetical protein
MSADDKSRDGMLYPHNVLEGFGSGALLDLRVRMAFAMLQHSPLFAQTLPVATEAAFDALPKNLAWLALGIADEVLSQGEARGWVKPLPDPTDSGIDPVLEAQAHRTAEYQAEQQLHGNKYATRQAENSIVPVAPGIRRPN